MKMLFFDYRESEKTYFNTHTHQGINITFYKENLTEDTKLTQEEKEETEIISVFVTSNITENIIKLFPNLKIIATRSSGYNHIDILACKKNNISVINVKDYGRYSVAQYTIGAIIFLTRNFITAINDFQLDNNHFDKCTGFNLEELSLGVIGTGSIGTSVCKTANHFGMKIFANDLQPNQELKNIVEYISLDKLYQYSDIISLHIPYTTNNYHLLSYNEFEQMKENVYIINTSRGELIDNKALYKYIKNGKISGAALDVLECETINTYPDDFINQIKSSSCNCLENNIINKKLSGMPNIMITPHIAYNTYHSINTILEETFLNIKNCINGKCSSEVI